MAEWLGTIEGEPASKANSRKLVTHSRTGRPMFVKSDKARRYLQSLQQQVMVCRPLLVGQLEVTMRIYYASERPDLDPSLILDGLQGRIYANDRQVRVMHLYHAIDRERPRTEVRVREIEGPLFERPS